MYFEVSVAKILIIEDDRLLCKMLGSKFREMGHEPVCAFTLEHGVQEVCTGPYDVVFLDVYLPDGDGIRAIPRIRDVSSRPEIIIMTGAGDPEGAEIAIRSGVWDYIEKASSTNSITLALIRALQYREMKLAKLRPPVKRDGIIGSSVPMQNCIEQVGLAASGDASVLITGETGTGKELIARAIHENSSRAQQEFVVVDCASLSHTLASSLLFGHGKGAYTGAVNPRNGLIKRSDNGTLFLDEIGELPLSTQKIFLRVLQERTFRPLGLDREVRSNFRVISATNRDIEKMAGEGTFRKDLLYRLKGITIDVPPLRERRGDISEIALHHIHQACLLSGKEPKECAPELLESLSLYDWPGNVRELINAMDRAFTAAGSKPAIFQKHLPDNIRVSIARGSLEQKKAHRDGMTQDTLPSIQELREEVLEKTEKEYLKKVLAGCGGDMEKAMLMTGLARSRFYELLRKYGVTDAYPSALPLRRKNPPKATG